MRHALFVTAASVLLTGCISIHYASGGETITQTRDLSSFDKLETSRGVSVGLTCGSPAHAVLHGPSDEVGNIDIHVEGRTLVVRRNSSWSGNHQPVHIDVTTPDMLDRLQASSGSTVEAQACALSSEKLDLEASSGATVKLAANTRHLSAEVSSGATIERLHDGRIDAGEADLRASSGGSMRVCTVGRLTGRASSGGSITSDEAGSADRSTSSGGSIANHRCG